jgi:hypothetical protein
MKLFGCCAGGLAIGTLGLSLTGSRIEGLTEAGERVPVRNPAFSLLPGEGLRNDVLFCRSGPEEYRAFEINAAGSRIWRGCPAHEDFALGRRRTVFEVAAKCRADLPAAKVVDFIDRMERQGIVYWGEGSVLYFEKS